MIFLNDGTPTTAREIDFIPVIVYAKKISLLTRLRLLFRKTNVGVDFGVGDDISCKVYTKMMDGKVYVIKTEVTK